MKPWWVKRAALLTRADGARPRGSEYQIHGWPCVSDTNYIIINAQRTTHSYCTVYHLATRQYEYHRLAVRISRLPNHRRSGEVEPVACVHSVNILGHRRWDGSSSLGLASEQCVPATMLATMPRPAPTQSPWHQLQQYRSVLAHFRITTTHRAEHENYTFALPHTYLAGARTAFNSSRVHMSTSLISFSLSRVARRWSVRLANSATCMALSLCTRSSRSGGSGVTQLQALLRCMSVR